ncbi:MAG TPA: hypothetical protein VLW85_05420 [Myxococcales bacterium]|nr:hypothetical protein [Myxococcales bacterium]
MTLPAAIAIADELRRELLAEIERAKAERGLLRTFDAQLIHARLQEREEFLSRTQELERRLRAATDGAAAISLDLSARLGELRSLAGTLNELTALNHQLARRAAECARAYVQALTPKAAAYDRRGYSRAVAAGAGLSRRA